jgi:hypothetical protein
MILTVIRWSYLPIGVVILINLLVFGDCGFGTLGLGSVFNETTIGIVVISLAGTLLGFGRHV